MFMRKQGGGGSRFTFPLETRLKIPGALGEMISPAWFSHLGAYWYYEDFLWDAFDIDEHPLALYDYEGTDQSTKALIADATGGAFQIKLGAASEEKLVGFTMNDNLFIQGNLPFIFATRLQVVHTMAANQALVWGLASDINTPTFDSFVRNCWFRVEGDTDLLIEADDASTDQDDKDTGINISAATYYWYVIERGFDGKVYFRVAEGDGDNVRTFNLKDRFGGTDPSFGANNLQPVILAYKSAGAAGTTPELKIDCVAFAGIRGS